MSESTKDLLAVVAIVRPGRGRRLGVVAAIVSVLGTLVTVGVLVWRVVAANGSELPAVARAARDVGG